jgi:hypothetical protein
VTSPSQGHKEWVPQPCRQREETPISAPHGGPAATDVDVVDFYVHVNIHIHATSQIKKFIFIFSKYFFYVRLDFLT